MSTQDQTHVSTSVISKAASSQGVAVSGHRKLRGRRQRKSSGDEEFTISTKSNKSKPIRKSKDGEGSLPGGRKIKKPNPERNETKLEQEILGQEAAQP